MSSTVTRVGFVGLGNIGKPMAQRLLAWPGGLVVFDLAPEPVAELEKAGAFSIVMEMVPAEVAARVTEVLHIPTIGIGAGPECDAQVLVWQDMAGLRGGKAPRFVKRYADLRTVLGDAARAYADDVAKGTFPDAEHSFQD